MTALEAGTRNGLQQGPEAHVAKGETLHPAWRSFVQYCERLRHGEIERLKIQDGLPVIAESVCKKVKFAP